MLRQTVLMALAVLFAPIGASAAEAQATPAALSAGETRFVASAARALAEHYPSPAAAERAGYIRYTNEDETGAISYAGTDWTSASIDRPAQLWYDVHGRLLGADYSVLVADHPTAPGLFGISSARFFEEDAHVHYVLRNSDGSLTYSRAVGFKKYAATGEDPLHPTAAGLVKTGVVNAPDKVAAVFLFPHIWDVTVWVIPNPAGPFAEANPNVKPSRATNPSDMH